MVLLLPDFSIVAPVVVVSYFFRAHSRACAWPVVPNRYTDSIHMAPWRAITWLPFPSLWRTKPTEPHATRSKPELSKNSQAPAPQVTFARDRFAVHVNPASPFYHDIQRAVDQAFNLR